MTERRAAPRPTIVGLAPLTRMAMEGISLAPIGDRLLAAIARDPEDAPALLSLSRVLSSKDKAAALEAQHRALSLRTLFHVPAARGPGLRLLVLMAPGGSTANTPIEFLLADSDVSLDLLFVGEDLALPPSLPEHDAVFVAIGESDETRGTLEALAGALDAWPRPVFNLPAAILKLSRDGASRLLEGAPGITMPASLRIERERLVSLLADPEALLSQLGGARFPLIARPVGTHMGQGLARVDSPEALGGFVEASGADEFFVSRFVDYAGPDGLFRKVRVALVEGKPFACHLAVSADWIVHYQTAGMEGSEARRAEEQRWMERFDEDFAVRHAAALAAIADRCGLDYLGIDAAEASDGSLLVFEVDNAVLVHAMDPVDLYPYKRPAMARLFAAFRAMLASRGGAPSTGAST